MPLVKLQFRPGVNRENTRYTSEGGWYDCDKIRFRQGTPEKIGGWDYLTTNKFLGACRNIHEWVSLSGLKYRGLGTHLKYYVERGASYNDITPLRYTSTGTAIFELITAGDNFIVVTDPGHNATEGSFVTFSLVSTPNAGPIVDDGFMNRTQGFYISEVISSTQYKILTVDLYTGVALTATPAEVAASPYGGAATVAKYDIDTGTQFQQPSQGWGAGLWGNPPSGTWGTVLGAVSDMRIWSHGNYGEDLLMCPRGGTIYYWDSSIASSATPWNRAVAVSDIAGASGVPDQINTILITDVSRQVFAFGSTPSGGTDLDPMLVRWSSTEDFADWTVTATNDAGERRLSIGSEIVTAVQQRQEILVWTDAALYSFQSTLGEELWSTQTLGENISIISPMAVASASNVTYWMGKDKFYMYDGRVQTLPCNILQYVFQNADPNLAIDQNQSYQIFASTVEEHNEIWWFYKSVGSQAEYPDRYIVYNYLQQIWYYGTMESRCAWIDSRVNNYPVSSYILHVGDDPAYPELPSTISHGYLIEQEKGVDDGINATGINAYVASTEVDIDPDGHLQSFIWRMLPDITFRGSTANDENTKVTMTLKAMKNSGSGYNTPASVGGQATGTVTKETTFEIERFTGQVNTRVRGRQVSIKIESTLPGVTWQLGSPRVDVRPDGRR